MPEQPMPLPNLEVSNFRAIQRLSLPRLVRVNLFVGKNNSGKSSLLEALQLYVSRSPGVELMEIIDRHNGLRPGPRSFGDAQNFEPQELQWALDACLGLISGSYNGDRCGSIKIGLAGDEARLTISLPWVAEYYNASLAGLFFAMDSPLVEIDRAGNSVALPLGWFLRRLPVAPHAGDADAVLLPAQGFSADDLYDLWRETAARGEAEAAESVLRVILPDLERVLTINENGFGLAAQLRGVRKPVPLTNMGDGTIRVFGLALAFLKARGGVLLIDEVENGLHHTVQWDVWESIFSLAERLDVQVFATTHSWEAVSAFQYAANRSSSEGILYRLERDPGGDIYVERYTEKEVSIAAEHQIEVR